MPHATTIGIPLRPAISQLDRPALRDAARARFGLRDDLPTLLVFGGSQGAQSINRAMHGAAPGLRAAGVQVLHIIGAKNTFEVPRADGDRHSDIPYVVVPYVDEMQYAYAAADLALCRCGAMTCAELSRGRVARHLRARTPSATASSATTRCRSSRPGERCSSTTPPSARTGHCGRSSPRITDRATLEDMSRAAARTGSRDADVVLARRVLDVAAEYRRFHAVSPDERPRG